MVSILQRSDSSLVHLCDDSDPVSKATRLSEGHAFDVSVVATVFVSTDTLLASLQKITLPMAGTAAVCKKLLQHGCVCYKCLAAR